MPPAGNDHLVILKLTGVCPIDLNGGRSKHCICMDVVYADLYLSMLNNDRIKIWVTIRVRVRFTLGLKRSHLLQDVISNYNKSQPKMYFLST